MSEFNLFRRFSFTVNPSIDFGYSKKIYSFGFLCLNCCFFFLLLNERRNMSELHLKRNSDNCIYFRTEIAFSEANILGTRGKYCRIEKCSGRRIVKSNDLIHRKAIERKNPF